MRFSDNHQQRGVKTIRQGNRAKLAFAKTSRIVTFHEITFHEKNGANIYPNTESKNYVARSYVSISKDISDKFPQKKKLAKHMNL